jgi:integrase/recombinase XerD
MQGRQPKRYFKKRSVPRTETAPQPWAGNPLMGYVRAFLEWSEVHGFRPQGVHLRDKALQRFVAWCDERAIVRIQDITLPILERYQQHLFHYRQKSGKPLSFTTQQLMLVPLKAFFKWAARERHILGNPASEIILPKKPASLPRYVLSIAQVESVLNETDVSHPGGVRDRAMLEALYSTGVRRTELAGLTVTDWNRGGTLTVRQGKGGRDRVVPVGARAEAWLARYADEVRPELVTPGSGDTLFLTDYGEAFEKNRLGDLVRRYLDWAGITVPGSCHLFRHACATHMLENGADVRYIQVLLGHADITSTEIYTKVSITKLREIHAATHPARLERVRTTQTERTRETSDGDAQALLDAIESEDEAEASGVAADAPKAARR